MLIRFAGRLSLCSRALWFFSCGGCGADASRGYALSAVSLTPAARLKSTGLARVVGLMCAAARTTFV